MHEIAGSCFRRWKKGQREQDTERKKEMEYVGHTSMMTGVYGRQEQQGSKLKRSTGIKVF